MNFTVIKTKNLQNLSLTNKKQPISVAVAQLLFLENSFQKHKILTSLEAILERFVFKMLKFRALTMELLKL